MATIGDICDTCGRVIKSYPIYGNGTCHVCRYEEFISKNFTKLKSDIDDFYKKRFEDGKDVGSIDFILIDLVEILPKMNDADVEALVYMINGIKERCD